MLYICCQCNHHYSASDEDSDEVLGCPKCGCTNRIVDIMKKHGKERKVIVMDADLADTGHAGTSLNLGAKGAPVEKKPVAVIVDIAGNEVDKLKDMLCQLSSRLSPVMRPHKDEDLPDKKPGNITCPPFSGIGKQVEHTVYEVKECQKIAGSILDCLEL